MLHTIHVIYAIIFSVDWCLFMARLLFLVVCSRFYRSHIITSQIFLFFFHGSAVSAAALLNIGVENTISHFSPSAFFSVLLSLLI